MAYSIVQTKASGEVSNASSIAVQFDDTTIAGNHFIATTVVWDGDGTAPSSHTMSDTYTNTWGAADRSQAFGLDSGNNEAILSVYRSVTGLEGETHEITCTFGDSGLSSTMGIYEVSGLNTDAPAVNSAANNAENSASVNSGSVTPNAAGFFLGVMSYEGGPATITPDTGNSWIELLEIDENNDTQVSASEYQDAAEGVGKAATWTISSNLCWCAVLVAYEEVSVVVIEQKTFQFFESGDELPHWDYSTAPLIEAGDITGSSDNSAGTQFLCSYPSTVNAGDLLIFVVGKDDDPAIVDVTGTLTEIGKGAAAGSLNGPYLYVGYKIAVGNEDSSNHEFSGDSEEFQGFCIRVPAGEFDSNRPIDAFSVVAGSNVDQETAVTPAFTVGRAGGTIIACGAVDIDPMDATFSPAGWTDLADVDAGEITAFISKRDAATTLYEAVGTAAFGINTTDSWAALAFVINAPRQADGRAPIDIAGADAVLVVDTDYGWHFRIESSGSVSAEDTFKIQYKHIEGTNTWTDVTDSSDVIRVSATADFANGADVPEFIEGLFNYYANNNAALDTSGALTLGAVLGSDSSFEGHLNFQILGSTVNDEDTVQLRVVYSDGDELEVYTDTPIITVNKPPTGFSNRVRMIISNT